MWQQIPEYVSESSFLLIAVWKWATNQTLMLRVDGHKMDKEPFNCHCSFPSAAFYYTFFCVSGLCLVQVCTQGHPSFMMQKSTFPSALENIWWKEQRAAAKSHPELFLPCICKSRSWRWKVISSKNIRSFYLEKTFNIVPKCTVVFSAHCRMPATVLREEERGSAVYTLGLWAHSFSVSSSRTVKVSRASVFSLVLLF